MAKEVKEEKTDFEKSVAAAKAMLESNGVTIVAEGIKGKPKRWGITHWVELIGKDKDESVFGISVRCGRITKYPGMEGETVRKSQLPGPGRSQRKVMMGIVDDWAKRHAESFRNRMDLVRVWLNEDNEPSMTEWIKS